MNMKKVLAMLLTASMAFSMVACGGNETTPSEEGNADASEPATEESTEGNSEEGEAPAASGEGYKAALLLNGTLGDKSFYDSANEGLTRLRDELGADTFDFKVEQMGGTAADEAKWGPTLLD